MIEIILNNVLAKSFYVWEMNRPQYSTLEGRRFGEQ